MSDASEVKAAAERLRRIEAGESLKAVYHSPTYPTATNYLMAYECDVAEVAGEYLRLTDETPADKAFVLSLGGVAQDHPDKVRFERGDALPIELWLVGDGWKAMLDHLNGLHACIVRGLKTRGEVRRFLDAVKALKEASK